MPSLPRNLRLETYLFLECLADAAIDGLGLLMHPSVGRMLARSARDDDRAFERQLQRLAAKGLIELPVPIDPRIVRITQAGRALVQPPINPEERWARHWDGLWRMVLFDVPEEDRPGRRKLRDVLRRTRLGYLQGSVWITPNPLAELRDTVAATAANPEALLFFEGHAIAGESDKSIIDGAWSFPKINARYREAIELGRSVPKQSAPPPVWRNWLTEEREAWTSALAMDPLLPSALLPPHYLGRTALKTHRSALRAATRHIFPETVSLPEDK